MPSLDFDTLNISAQQNPGLADVDPDSHDDPIYNNPGTEKEDGEEEAGGEERSRE